MKEWKVEYYRLPFDSGLPKGRNFLVEKAKTKYILMAEDDFYFDKEAQIEKLMTLMEISDIAGGLTRTPKGVERYEAFLKRENDILKFERIYDDNLKEFKGVKYKETDICFNYFVAKRKIFEKVKWDEKIKIVFEHADFFLRVKEAGFKVVYTPEAVVKHRIFDFRTSAEYSKYRWRVEDCHYFFDKWKLKYVIDINGYKYDRDYFF